jgi:hypothetical protein
VRVWLGVGVMVAVNEAVGEAVAVEVREGVTVKVGEAV